jgi:hypothetical protein
MDHAASVFIPEGVRSMLLRIVVHTRVGTQDQSVELYVKTLTLGINIEIIFPLK